MASICGGYVALHDALSRLTTTGAHPLVDACAAVSVAVVGGRAVLDPDYREDAAAEVDMNVVMTSAGELIEIQGTAERAPFDRRMLDRLLDLAAGGIAEIIRHQRETLRHPPAPRPGA